MKIIRILSLLVLFVFPLKAAFAADNNLLTIADISVSSSSTNSTEARDKAIAEAEAKAFSILSQRISENNGSKAPNLSADEISRLVNSMEIRNEKVTNSYYSATVNIIFSPEILNKFDKPGSSQASTTTSGKTILVIPLIVENNNDAILSEGNNWYKDWQDLSHNSASVIYRLAKNNDNLTNIKNALKLKESGTEINNKEAIKSELNNLKRNYGTSNIFAVIAYTTTTLSSFETSVHLINLNQMLAETMKLSPPDNQDSKEQDNQQAEDINKFYPPKEITNNLSALDSAYKAITLDIDKYIKNSFSQITAISTQKEKNKTEAIINISNLQEWLDITHKLKNSSNFNFTTKEISINKVSISLLTEKTKEELIANLQELSFTVKENSDGSLLISNNL